MITDDDDLDADIASQVQRFKGTVVHMIRVKLKPKMAAVCPHLWQSLTEAPQSVINAMKKLTEYVATS